ncbi:sodium:neurotransmitter symporter family protein, partial [Cystoisospora suis]
MMQKLTFRSRRNRSAVRQGVTDLEHVESLEVKHGDRTNVDEQDDALLGRDMSASPFFHADYANEVRRQVYNESLIYRTTPLYFSKVAFEQRIDEHRLLHAHLQALERSEQNGPLLMSDEVMFSDVLWSHLDNNTTAIGGPGNPSLTAAGSAARRMYTAPRSTSMGQAGPPPPLLQPMTSNARIISRYLSMPNQLSRFIGGRFSGVPAYGGVGGESTGRRSQRSSEVEQGASDSVDDGSGSAQEAEPPDGGGQGGGSSTISGVPKGGRGDERSGGCWAGDKRFLRRERGGGHAVERRPTLSSATRAADQASQLQGGSSSSGAGGTVQGGTNGPVRAYLSRLRSSFDTWGAGGLTGVGESQRSGTGEIISDVGGQPHVLNWTEWLGHQRARGWYSSEALYFMTALGAVMGAGNFTSFWSQLQIWEGMLFILPYCFNFLTIGLPTMQTEISHWLVGAGVLTIFSNLLRVSLKADVLFVPELRRLSLSRSPSVAQSCHLLIYFLSSWKLPHPWQVTEDDQQLCRSMLEQDTCEKVGVSTLCHWLPGQKLCLASPTGK